MARGDNPAEKFALPKKDADLIKFLNKRWDEGKEFRAAADIQAFWNLAFYRGYQWLYEGDRRSATTLQRLPVDADDPDAPVMLTVNKVGSRVDRAIAEVTSNTPGIECRPVSEEDADMDAARVGTRISAAEDRRQDIETLLPETYSWVVPCGWAYWQLTWNHEDGRYVGDDPDPQLAAEGIRKALHEGNCEAKIRPHFEVVLHPMATDAWDSRWAITQSAMTEEEIYQVYNKFVEKGIGLLVISDELGSLATTKQLRKQERIAVRQFWLRPGQDRSCPEGMVFTWAGETVLEAAKPWPYKRTTRLPLIQFNYYPPQGGYFGRTPVSDLIDLQVGYNVARSLEADIASRMLPKAFYQDGSFEPEEVSARFEWVPVLSGAQMPQVESFDAGWMQQHELVMKRADMEMDERMHQPDSARGAAAGTSPAAGTMAQQEAARKPYSIPAKMQARALKRFGWQRLMLIRQYWREERLVRTWSRAGTLSVERFQKADVDRELDTEVRAESILPRSKAAQAQLALQLMQAKTPGFDIRHFVRMIDLPGTDIISEMYDADERHAERENQYLATRGRKAPAPPKNPEENDPAFAKWVDEISKLVPWVTPRDNHPVHIETHRLHMISPEFERYPDKVKALFEAHIQQHEMILGQRQQAQQAAQALPGQGGLPAGNNGQAGPPQIPGIAELAGLQGGPGGGMSQPGVPAGVSPDLAAELVGR